MMERLYALQVEPVPLLWSQLRTRLPKIVELPAPVGLDADDDGQEVFKRIDRLTRNELDAHMQIRKNTLLLEIQTMQLLGELYRYAAAAKCGADEPVFAAIEAREVRQ